MQILFGKCDLFSKIITHVSAEASGKWKQLTPRSVNHIKSKFTGP